MSTVIPTASLVTVLDELAAWYVAALGSSASGLGLGSSIGGYGAYDAADDIVAALAGCGEIDPVVALGPSAQALRTNSQTTAFARTAAKRLLDALDQHCNAAQTGVTSLDTYLTYLNCTAATKWAALAPPAFRDLYGAVKNLAAYPAANNVYFEVLQGATYANGLRKLVVGTGQTAGFSVDTAKYCGGFGYLVASGITGSGVVTVTGTAFDPATKAISAGKTWTATVSGNGTVALTVGTAPANSLLTAVTDITAEAGITAGTIYAEAHRPAGRPLI